ncbi:MAG TPA: PxKF domain-containing protein [Pyrinomonadaceae bacterium]
MSLHPPFVGRSTTRLFNLRLRKFSWPALALVLLATLMTWTGSAAAACNFLLKFGSTGSGPGQFLNPRGIAVDNAGNVYVPDENNRVQKFDSSGVFVLQFGVPGDVNGGFVTPWKVATDAAGNVYASDSFTNRVQKFNSSGVFQMSLGGGPGSGNGQFIAGTAGIAVDSAGNIYVADPGNHRVQKFSPAGAFITAWGGSGTGNGQFSAPGGMAVDASDNIYVADTGNHRIQKFNSSGTFLTKWGSNGTATGQFNGPQGISVDTTGNVYVADTGNNRIQKFSSTGVFIDSCGSAGTGDGELSGPHDVAADASGNIFVADTGNERIQKFGPAPATPIADAGPDQTVECAGALTSVTLDGTASTPGSGTINAYDWTEGATTLGSGSTLNVSLPAGSHTITLTVTDTGGGTDSDDVIVNIVDTTDPIISCPANVVVMLPPNSSATSMAVDYPAVTAMDSCSSSVTVESSPASGSVFPVGTTTVNATATDDAGNDSACSFTVTVNYNFAGFFSPVNNLPVVNTVNAGRAIPVKFSLSGDKGLNIFAPNSPSSGPIACNSSDPAVVLEDTVTAGGSSLSYDAASDQYVYIWKTSTAWAGTCRQLVVQLNDGSIYRANFKFK